MNCNMFVWGLGAFVLSSTLALVTYLLASYEIRSVTERQTSLLYGPAGITTFLIFTWYTISMHYALVTFNDLHLIFTIPFFATLLLFSLLIGVTMHTDAQTLLISRRYTLLFIPVGWFLARIDQLPITSHESIVGSMLGITFLWGINMVGKYYKKQHVVGQGDVDLMGLIGAFTGFRGCWFALLFGSWIGIMFIVVAVAFNYFFKKTKTATSLVSQIPFGLFLGYGILAYLWITTTQPTRWIGQFCLNFPFLH